MIKKTRTLVKVNGTPYRETKIYLCGILIYLSRTDAILPD